MSTQLANPQRWQPIQKAYSNLRQDYLDFCKEAAILLRNEGVARFHADYVTQDMIALEFDMSQEQIAKAVKIGNDKRIILNKNISLPKSTYSIYALTTLDDDGFYELAKPDTTQADILAYKKRLAAPKKVAISPPTPEQQAIIQERQEAKALEDKEDYEAKLMHEEFYISNKPASFLAKCVGELLELHDEATIKAVKGLLARAYHPDSGRIKHDEELMARINLCFTNLENQNV